jgi:hypothetical protein
MKRPNITPGPWRTDRAGVNVIDPKEKAEYVLCHCHESRLTVIEANARAIAALPDLLAALESLHRLATIQLSQGANLDGLTNCTALAAARAALIKAGYEF